MEGCVIVSYRCNARCQMCHRWEQPSRKDDEISPLIMDKLPTGLSKLNLTGGEPALREDLVDIVGVLRKKTSKIDLSTNGYFTERLVEVGRKYPDVAFRISVEGLPKLNDNLRGLKDGFDRALRTILQLREVGVRDIGFGVVISDKNKKDLLNLYRLCSHMNIEFGNATMHNSFYFNKYDNAIEDVKGTVEEMHRFIEALLQSRRSSLRLRVKDWGRAYINLGILLHILNQPRPIPCGAGTDNFFLDPYGDIIACNGSETPWIMGNLRDRSFSEIWQSEEAKAIRERVLACKRACWMVGTARPAMRKQPWVPLLWILRNKIKLSMGKDIWC